MLFAIKYTPRSTRTDAESRRAREIFVAWSPPATVEIKHHFHYVEGGGVIIAETELPTALYESVAPFQPMTDFDIVPVVNVIEAIAISMDVDEWVDSVRANRNHNQGDQRRTWAS